MTAHCDTSSHGFLKLHRQELAASLKQNSTIQILHLETNQISGKAIKQLIAAIVDNKALIELKLTNQVCVCVCVCCRKCVLSEMCVSWAIRRRDGEASMEQ